MPGILGAVFERGKRAALQPVTQGLNAFHHEAQQVTLRLCDERGSRIERWTGTGDPELLTQHFPLDNARICLASRGECRDAIEPDTGIPIKGLAVMDGRICNAEVLRARLGDGRLESQVISDADLLMALFQQHGPTVFGEVEGGFAFAGFDFLRRRLILARDSFGIKALYYTEGEDFAFASELLPLLDAALLPRRVSPDRLSEFLVSGRIGHSGQSIFRNIQQVPEGCWLEMREGQIAGSPVEYKLRARDHSEEGANAPARLRALLSESVRRSAGAWEVGTTLSGGLDSSAIAAILWKIRGPGQHVFTFGGGGDDGDSALNELPWAELVQRHVGGIMHPVGLDAEEVAARFQDIVTVHDEPLGSPVALVHLEFCHAAKRLGLKGLLSGHGPDQMFGGSHSHIASRLLSLALSGKAMTAARLAKHAAALPDMGWAGLVRRTASLAAPEWMRRASSKRRSWPVWMNPKWRTQQSPPQESGRHPRSMVAIMREQARTILPIVLRMEERNGAASGIESCFPFLTPQMADFAFSLPDEWRVSDDACTKPVLRQAVMDWLPAETVARRERIGFAIPARSWLWNLRPWIAPQVKEICELAPLSADAVRETWTRFSDGVDTTAPAVFLLWRWLFLARWARANEVSFDSP